MTGFAESSGAPPLTIRPRVVVAVLTYLRPEDLPAAVDAVLEQAGGVVADVAVLVVDNDPAGGAMALASRWLGDRVRFVHEPRPGIAAARNRALDQAGAQDLLVFIDDDERPEPGWLGGLLGTWEQDRPAAVVGPVISALPEELDPWIAAGGFFVRRRLQTGTEVSVAATNNLLLDLEQVRALGLRFDEAFGESGGSDTLFTRQLHRRGGRMVWCDTAVVRDIVPPGRLTRSWVRRRALRLGNSWSRVALALESGSGRRALRRLDLTVSGIARIAGGAARVTWGIVARSMRHRARGTRTVLRGAGMIAGAWGYTYAEYRRSRHAP
jgi:succinoglycan biosynthesis protein ExoM